jgi:hypothetical protein
MVKLVPHVKQDMYSVDGCSFRVHGTVNVMEQSEDRCLKLSLKRDGRVSEDIVLVRVRDAVTFGIRAELRFILNIIKVEISNYVKPFFFVIGVC